MDSTHIHIVITHLPIFGTALGMLVLIQGILAKSKPTVVAAYTVFICSSIGATIAYLTGEGAEEVVENIQGISEAAIERHEEFAIFAFIALIILGIASLIGLLAEYKKVSFARGLSIGVLLISLVGFGLVANTGFLGGQIRHTEINAAAAAQPQGGGSEVGGESEDDD